MHSPWIINVRSTRGLLSTRTRPRAIIISLFISRDAFLLVSRSSVCYLRERGSRISRARGLILSLYTPEFHAARRLFFSSSRITLDEGPEFEILAGTVRRSTAPLRPRERSISAVLLTVRNICFSASRVLPRSVVVNSTLHQSTRPVLEKPGEREKNRDY